MRISKDQARANREQIVETAAGLFRKRGFDGIGVADLLKSAGFTHGALYNHFQSKDELAAAASEFAFRKLDEETAKMGSVEDILTRYISAAHRDEIETACPAAALGGEAAHQPKEVAEAFSVGIDKWLERLDGALKLRGVSDGNSRRQLAVNLLATAVGAIVLARASSTNLQQSDEILEVSLKGVLAGVERGVS